MASPELHAWGTMRLLLRLSELVDGAIQLILTNPYADKKKIKAAAGMGWYHYFRMNGFDKFLACGVFDHGLARIRPQE